MHRENREMYQRNSLSGKTQGIWKICTVNHAEKTAYFVCFSPKFPDSKDQGYCAICHIISQFFLEV